MRGGGVWPAIVGTFYLMIGSALFAFPLGIMSGIYMHEYAKSGRVVKFIRMMTNNLAGIPSIVFGLFRNVVVCQLLRLRRQHTGRFAHARAACLAVGHQDNGRSLESNTKQFP